MPTVTFSKLSQLAIIPEWDEASTSEAWYTKDDKIIFQRALLRDARRVAAEVERAPLDAPLTADVLYECVGIEAFVTDGLMARIAERRRAHVRAVLVEQRLQKELGIHDPERLAAVSSQFSRSMKDRARRLAFGYGQLL